MSKQCVMCDAVLAMGKGPRRFCGPVCQIKANCSCVAPKECWPWRSASRNGYAVMRIRIGSEYLTRPPMRIMYAASHGGVPAGHEVVNTCGTKNCCKLNEGFNRLPDQCYPLYQEGENCG